MFPQVTSMYFWGRAQLVPANINTQEANIPINLIILSLPRRCTNRDTMNLLLDHTKPVDMLQACKLLPLSLLHWQGEYTLHKYDPMLMARSRRCSRSTVKGGDAAASCPQPCSPGEMMPCARCGALRVPEIICEGGTRLLALRCIHCGDIIDQVIALNRQRRPRPKSNNKLPIRVFMIAPRFH